MNKETFGKFVADIRREKNMTQQALAEQLHVTNTAVSKWERGLSYPDLALFESLARALDLTVVELMACSRLSREELPAGCAESNIRSVLTIVNDTASRHRKRVFLLGGILFAAALVVAAVVYYFSVLAVSETRYAELVGKQTEADKRYVYVEKDTHLLRLQCQDPALYDSLKADGRQLYRLEYCYNRMTNRGTLETCQELGEDSYLGTPLDEAGSSWYLDNSLLGMNDVLQKTEYVMEDPARKGKYLYTFCYYGKAIGKPEQDIHPVDLAFLRVENCRAALPYDYDSDGIWELFVLTRYEEEPFLLYDLENGMYVSRFVEEVPEDVQESLKSMAFDTNF